MRRMSAIRKCLRKWVDALEDNNSKLKDPCNGCIVSQNCSNACVDLVNYYTYLSEKVREELKIASDPPPGVIPGVTKQQVVDNFEKIDRHGRSLVRWWEKLEKIHG